MDIIFSLFAYSVIFCDCLRLKVDTLKEAENDERIFFFLVLATQEDPSGYSWNNWQVMYFNGICF